MRKEINDQINNLIEILDKDERIIKLKKKKETLISNQTLIKDLEKLRNLDIYSNEYKQLKQKLFENPDFIEFKQLENEINLLILEINQKLNTLTNERSCDNENN